MTLHVFRDRTAVIVGVANNKIESSVSGTLSIGSKNITLAAHVVASLPPMSDGSHPITFTAEDGAIYHGAFIAVNRGKLIPQQNLTPRECALIHRLDRLEELYEDIAVKYKALSEKYDVNALNFISDK